ncbi:MAG: TolC family protein [Bacteroidales bacterium]|nr:TolC family protein [Bacteroidales bacterium]MCI1785599.1 TolC family protein [Bacteroidales bacterium]
MTTTRTGLLAALCAFCTITIPASLCAQEMTLKQVINAARINSVEAAAARSSFVSSYWAWRSYQASRLPSLNLYGTMMSFDRSLQLLQDTKTGEMRYVSSNNLQNSLGLYLGQNITFTGGTLKLYSDLTRIDEFGVNNGRTWYSQPVTLSYTQPLMAYNQYKWDKLISPKEYEEAKRIYLEAMEKITDEAVQEYFSLAQARKTYEIAMTNYRNTSKMFGIAKERMKIGSITREDYLQLELKMLNDSTSINDAGIKVKEAGMTLNSLLGLDENSNVEPLIDDRLPDVSIDYETVLDKALANSSFNLGNEINILNSKAAIAKAKAQRGATVTLNAKFGMSNSSDAFRETYKNLLDQEVVGMTFSIPIFDWGMGTGRVKKAEASAKVTKAQVEQAENDYRNSIFTAVGQFNNQRQQCYVSKRASEIASERYSLMIEKFRNGNISVTDLITSQNEKDSALQKYLTDLGNFWNYYYALRKLTLFDFIGNKVLDVDYNEITK